MIDLQNAKIILIILLLSSSAFSQGSFLQKGSDGLSVSSGYRYDEDDYNIKGKVGYSINGIFDFGIGISKGVSRQKVLNQDLNTLSLNPFISLTEHSNPLIISVSFSYRHDFIESDAFDILNIKASGDYYAVGSSIRARILESEYFFLQPFISAEYVAGRDKAYNDAVNGQSDMENSFTLLKSSIKNDTIYQEIPPGQTRSDFTRELILSFGIDFCLITSNRLILFMTPNFILEEDNNFIGINAGIVLPAPYKSKAKPIKDERIVPVQSEKAVYVDIKAAMENHFLIYMSNETTMKQGDSFYVVRADKKDSSRWIKIGVAKVVIIKDHKVMLEADLYDENDRVTIWDKILFRY